MSLFIFFWSLTGILGSKESFLTDPAICAEVSDAIQYFTMAPTGNLSAQGFYLINRLLETSLGQERRKATTSLGWDESRGAEETLLQHGSRRNGKKSKKT